MSLLASLHMHKHDTVWDSGPHLGVVAHSTPGLLKCFEGFKYMERISLPQVLGLFKPLVWLHGSVWIIYNHVRGCLWKNTIFGLLSTTKIVKQIL